MRIPHVADRPAVFIAAAVLLLAVMFTAMYSSARRENVTWDEAGHIPHGYVIDKMGNYWFDQVHAALPRMLAGAPLLAVDPRIPTEHVSWRTYDFFTFRHIFLFRNRVKPDRMVMLGRLPTMLCALLLGLVLALWTRRRFGSAAGLLALAFYALDPNFLAHGHYATTDLYTAAAFFFAVIAWERYLRSLRGLDLVLAGLLTGVAFATKHSLLFLLVVLPVLYCLGWWREPRRYSARRLLGSMLVVALLGAAVVALVYLPVTEDALAQHLMMRDHVADGPGVQRLFHAAATMLPIPYHPYIMGFYWLAKTAENGLPSYLLGHVSTGGWWYFFPVVLAVKSPTGLLIALALATGTAIGILARRDPSYRPRSLPFAWLVVTVTPLLYLTACLFSPLNEGIRHALPAYPFLYAFAAAMLTRSISRATVRKARNAALAVVLGLLVLESAIAYPHYLAFFNLPAGGSANGIDYVVNSNLDWGQDLKNLKVYLDSQGIDQVCLAYFGTADPDYYGIRHRELPAALGPGQQPPDCVAAVSATYLVGLYAPPGGYSWLRGLDPMKRVGDSIYVYDLRKRRR